MSSSNRHVEASAEIPSFGDAARAAKDALNVASRRASATIHDLGNEAYETSSKARDQIVHQVESQPLTSVLLAAGIGLLAGLLWSHR